MPERIKGKANRVNRQHARIKHRIKPRHNTVISASLIQMNHDLCLREQLPDSSDSLIYKRSQLPVLWHCTIRKQHTTPYFIANLNHIRRTIHNF